MGWQYEYIPAWYGNELQVWRKHYFMSVLLSDVWGSVKVLRRQIEKFTGRWSVRVWIGNPWSQLPWLWLVAVQENKLEKGGLCLHVFFLSGWVGLLCWPLYCCPVEAGLEQKQSLTWVQLLKSEFEDKLCFPCFFLVCRRKKGKTDDALGGKERYPLNNPCA